MSEPGAPREAGGANEGPDPNTLPETTETRRPLGLTVLLVALVALNVAAGLQGLDRRANLFGYYPRLTPTLYAAWIAGPLLTILGCLGLWLLRRWGLWVATGAWALVMAVDLWAGITFHALVSTAAMWLVIIMVRPVRHALK
jgi:hypothetical protein